MVLEESALSQREIQGSWKIMDHQEINVGIMCAGETSAMKLVLEECKPTSLLIFYRKMK